MEKLSKFMGPMAILAVVGLVLFFALTGGSSSVSDDEKAKVLEVQDDDHKSGTGEVVIVEYGDFECPACSSFFTIAQQVKSELGDDSTFVFRNFPLTGVHPNAMAAHRAAEAAAKQDKFWEMHDVIFENQSEWGRGGGSSLERAAELLKSYAVDLGLDMDKYNTDIASGEVQQYIQDDLQGAKEIGVTGTPSIFVNGEKITYTNSLDFEAMKKIIQNAKDGKPLQSSEDKDSESLETSADQDSESEDSSDSDAN